MLQQRIKNEVQNYQKTTWTSIRKVRDPSIITATASPAKYSESEYWSLKNISLGFETACSPDCDISNTPSWQQALIISSTQTEETLVF